MNELLYHLKKSFKNEESRYVYAESLTNAFISEQIKRLMDDRGLSQEDLAVLIGTKQSGISRLQKRDYSAWKVETLRKLARAFGVRLCISFEEFGTIPNDVAGFTPENLAPRAFANDPVFHPAAAGRHAPTIDKEDSAISSRRPTTGVSKKRSRRTDSRRRPARAASQRRKR